MQQRRTFEDFANAIKEANGIVAIAAKMLGVSRSAFYKRIDKSKKLEAILIEARETNLDFAESKLIKHMNKPDMDAVSLGAVKYFLSTMGKDRGYYTKVETNKNINKPLHLEYHLNTAKNAKKIN